jgi:hypothetical protein
MTDDEHDEILRQAFENIAKRDAEADELDARRLENLGRVDPEDARTRFLRRRAALPPKPEKLDTAPPDFNQRLAAEREFMLAIFAETIALERRDVDERVARLETRIATLETLGRELERRALDNNVVEKLSADACKMTAQVATLERCISDLRATVASEAQRGSVIDLPTFRYPRDLN